jgi:hypothetical protein
MIPLLAQSTQPLSYQTVGVIVLTLVLLTRWLWDYNRAKREENALHEPRANPPLHKEYVTREQHAKLEQEFRTESARQSNSRKGIYAQLEDQGKQIARLETNAEVQTRQLSNLDQKMDQVLLRLPRTND